jgi:outer membrane protein OmpA-like peptidoglycan-associated protein
MNNSLRKILLLSLLFFSSFPLFSQVLSQKQFIKAVKDADIFYYYDEDYEKAASLYESLLNIFPDNLNISAKLGNCYLNIDGKKADAMRLLTKAVKNVVKNDMEYVEYGDKAPLDTYLYVAIAYHKNDSLEKAILLYGDAKRKLAGTQIFRNEFIDNQIRNCKYALEMEKKPQYISTNLFIPWLSEYPGACNPVLSKNDSVFIFTLKKDGKTSIKCSYKTDKWNKPVDITRQLGRYDRLYSNSITGDGKLLILYMDDGGDGNLYYSQRKDTIWTKIKNLGKNINTIYWESHGFITPDGNTLYIASNRPGGAGELDIWISERSDDGSLKRPVNCGRTINTPYSENTPFFDPSANTLLFSSTGQISMGGYDVFQSIRKNGTWSKPLGIPYAFNNTEENTFFIFNNNAPGFITSLFDEKTRSRNIYSITAEDKPDKNIVAKGTISLQDGMPVDPKQTTIQLTDQKTGAPIRTIYITDSIPYTFEAKPGDFKILISHIGQKTDTINLNVKKENPSKINNSLLDTASYKFEINPGDYMLYVSHTGYKTDTINLIVPAKHSGSYISLNTSMVPDKVFKGNYLSIKNILFEYDSFSLNDKALSTLELLKTILNDYPELKVEVAGYTDSRGSDIYNMKLAEERVQVVIDYFSSSGIPSSRFIKKAFGKSDFEALNNNPDGSDNPEGRKYNRRTTFGIVDPHTGIVLRQETFTPEHLRQPFSMKYSIVLKKAKGNLPENYFNALKINDMQVIRSIKADTLTLYTLGLFYNKFDASKYLGYARENGFKDAYLVNQYEINNSSESIKFQKNEIGPTTGKSIYTIQLKASKRPLNMNLFKGFEGVKEVASTDGYYRYVFGEYSSFREAKTALVRFHESGFETAFIRDFNSLLSK